MEISLNSCRSLVNSAVFFVSVISCNKRNKYNLKGILDVWNIFDFSVEMNLLLATVFVFKTHF